ncbi:MAG: ion channel [Terriglobia bacterium]
MNTQVPPSLPLKEEPKDLGFGSVVARESRLRLLNRDGSFNVSRAGLRVTATLNLYHSLLTMSWSRFLLILSTFYLVINALFALIYLLCGSNALNGPGAGALESPFLRAFFFSIQTFATIGYGQIGPVGLAANLIVTFESFAGLLALALATGMIFARFSRPTAKILFSNHAVIAPYQGGSAFEFRVANTRKNQLIELEAKVLFSRMDAQGGRQFYELQLERRKVVFFPLSWTIVHPIDGRSPLSGLTEQDFHHEDAEFLVLLTGIDETFSQTVHARSSYKAHEIVWNARFTNIFNREDGRHRLRIDVNRLHDIERSIPESHDMPQIPDSGS